MEFLKSAVHLFYIHDWIIKVTWKGSRNTNTVALSFDDGPHEVYTPQVLEILHHYNVRGTFFWIVQHAIELQQRNPDMFQNIINTIKADGHEIGLHGPDVIPAIKSRLAGTFSKEAMRRDKQHLEQLIGMPIVLFRPHYIQLGRSVRFAKEIGMTTVLGSMTAFAGNPSQLVQAVKFSLSIH